MQPLKASTSVEEQIQILRRRGMALEPEEARRWLNTVGYYRLSGYAFVYRGPEADHFLPGVSFGDVVALYEFDRKLRTLIHDGIERVEIGLRAAVSRVVADRYGAEGHLDPVNFRPTFDHAEWLAVAGRRAARAKRHTVFVRHHEDHYAGRMPIWVVLEVLDFADVSRLVDGMRVADQWAVADHLGLELDLATLPAGSAKRAKKNHPVARWCEQLSIVRNTAAHHGRVWNRSFAPAPTAALASLPGMAALPSGQSERIGGALMVIAACLRTLSPGSSWAGRIRRLVETELVPTRPGGPGEMGLQTGWNSPGGVLGTPPHG
ncbi:Abi family protein [Micrococcus sp. EYE_162]|uniref:Abi family protein n=1 Tax=unclassified Micrococcus TaxID=2620948 RepID=UPI002006CDBC|nr:MULTISPECIES: Abi family protein [unclassified Micrococcus]MCK6096412.1 Abi family protein [Micrococcus sp. EYE_212]MCK6172592.1 Abi family protein [Micrococcus sp. EYE_162]